MRNDIHYGAFLPQTGFSSIGGLEHNFIFISVIFILEFEKIHH